MSGKRILVCGSRNWTAQRSEFVRAELNRFVASLEGVSLDDWREPGFGPPTEWCSVVQRNVSCLIHGAQRGVDELAAEWAKYYGVLAIPFRADWYRHGKASGPRRNALMIQQGRPDVVIAFPSGEGTGNMVIQAMKAGIEVHHIDDGNDPLKASCEYSIILEKAAKGIWT